MNTLPLTWLESVRNTGNPQKCRTPLIVTRVNSRPTRSSLLSEQNCLSRLFGWASSLPLDDTIGSEANCWIDELLGVIQTPCIFALLRHVLSVFRNPLISLCNSATVALAHHRTLSTSSWPRNSGDHEDWLWRYNWLLYLWHSFEKST